MRPIERGNCPNDSAGIPVVFEEYSRARRYLIDALGGYCSYCERKIEANLAVEHVLPKVLNPAVALEWSNFLLGCTNCNSTKGAKPIVITEYFWPDVDNTFNVFLYDNSGIVKISSSLINGNDKDKANNTIELVGLGVLQPKTGTVAWQEASDRRFEHRLQAFIDSYNHSETYRKSGVNTRKLLIPLIKTIVVSGGFWSIWMNAFQDFPEVQRIIINSYPGTNNSFFTHIP